MLQPNNPVQFGRCDCSCGIGIFSTEFTENEFTLHVAWDFGFIRSMQPGWIGHDLIRSCQTGYEYSHIQHEAYSLSELGSRIPECNSDEILRILPFGRERRLCFIEFWSLMEASISEPSTTKGMFSPYNVNNLNQTRTICFASSSCVTRS